MHVSANGRRSPSSAAAVGTIHVDVDHAYDGVRVAGCTYGTCVDPRAPYPVPLRPPLYGTVRTEHCNTPVCGVHFEV